MANRVRKHRAAARDALAGQVCLVTGGAQGIGWAIARAVAARGARVHVADHSREHLNTAAGSLPGPMANRVTFHHIDVSDRTAYEACIRKIHRDEGRLDVLVNNAAFVEWRDVTDTSPESTERTMRTGLDAVVHGIQTVLPVMQTAGRGHIVTIGSAAGVMFFKGPSAAYTAMKAAVNAYTHVLAAELADSPIHVLLVRPGAVAGTEFFGKHVASHRMPRLADILPLTTPDQVAQAVLRGITRRQAVVDIPRSLPLLYRAYALAPGLWRRLTMLTGPSRRDYAALPTRRRPMLRIANRIGPSRLTGLVTRAAIVPADKALQRGTTGRMSLGRALGLPSLLLTTTGARSGQPRDVPLFHVPHEGGFAVIASNFGLTRHPAWSTNLLKHPNATVVTVVTDGQCLQVTARLVDGAEREQIWRASVAQYRGYRSYGDRSGRDLRIFHLQPTPALGPQVPDRSHPTAPVTSGPSRTAGTARADSSPRSAQASPSPE